VRILGVDPGTYRTGAGIIEKQGSSFKLVHFEVIRPKAKLSLPQRLAFIHQTLNAIISEHQPQVLALENVFFGKDAQAMVKIGEARACAMLAASALGIDVIEYPPARVKQAVTGNGRASKEQVQQMVKVLLNLESVPEEDGADALAAAICHSHSVRNPIAALIKG
jgi:crossover junction endodeoxyribonuclease RuvC